ncbi:MAG: hypothetical protein ACTHKY_17025 [Ginsengibacter sp.]
MFEMNQLAELQILYPEYKGLIFEDLLQGISKDTLLRISTYLTGKNIYNDEEIDSNDLIKNWFSDANTVFADQFYDRLRNYEEKNQKTLTIVSPISCLKILQYGLELEEQAVNRKSLQQSEIDILFALLICNQNEDYNQNKDVDKMRKMFPEDFLEVLVFNQSFAVNDIINFYFGDYTYCQVVKSLLLFGFLDSLADGKEILNRFCHYYEIVNWREYFESVIPLISAWSKTDKPSSVDIILNNDDNYADNYSFLKKLAMNDYVKLEDLDYIKLREKPLLELDATTFRVIHPLFISDKIYKGLYFLLNKLNSAEPIVKKFRSWYTSNFTEGVCFREIIKYSFAKYDVRLFDDQLNDLGVTGPPDCYLREDSDVFLIENKDILINATIKGSYDFEATINEIKKKLLSENGRPVGIGQLITNIRKLLNNENKFDKGFSTDATTIYQLIVVHDSMFDTVGLNKILNIFFNEELGKLKNEGFNISKVKSLALINIDTLIQLSDPIKEYKCTLKELFEAFYKNSIVPDNLQGNMMAIQDSLVPFSIFVVNYMNAKFGKQWRSENLFKYLFEKYANDKN